MKEIWRDIKGFEGLYKVSNKGRVKSLKRKAITPNGKSVGKDKILLEHDNGHGYISVKFYTGERFYIHRLVAEAFIKNPNQEKYVNHIDYNPKNNYAENLEWCSQKENIHHSIEHMRNPKNRCKPTNTGEKYIYKKKNGLFRVCIDCGSVYFDKQFHSFEEALAVKNELICSLCKV